MGLVTYNIPPANCFTRNPIRYKMGTDIDLETPGLFVECLVAFKSIQAATYTNVIAFPLTPDAQGLVEIDLSRIVHRLLDHTPPTLAGGVQKAREQIGMLRATFTEYSLDLPTGGTPTQITPVMVVKGGLSHERFQNNVWWDNYFPTQKILSWLPLQRTILPWVNEWITILYTGPLAGSARGVVDIYYTDATTEQIEFDFPEGGIVEQNHIYHIPAGYANLNLAAVTPAKKVHYYTVRPFAGSTPLADLVTFTMHYDPGYEQFHLNFFNSLGGFDSIPLTGEATMQGGRDYDLVDVNTSRSNFNTMAVPPMSQMNRVTEQIIFKSNIGNTHSWQWHDLRRELFLSEKILTRKNNRWWPVNVLDKTVDLGPISAQVKDMPIEWAYAFSNTQYTPEGVALGLPPNFSISTICLLITYEITNASIRVQFTHAPAPVDQYIIYLLDSDGDGLDGTTKNLPFTSPIEHTFTGLDALTVYKIRIVMRNTETSERRVCDYAPVTTTNSADPVEPTVFAHSVRLAEGLTSICTVTPQTVYSASSILGQEASVFSDIDLLLPIGFMNYIVLIDNGFIYELDGNIIGNIRPETC